ncbi:kinase, partial [Thraustotheca clavata]
MSNIFCNCFGWLCPPQDPTPKPSHPTTQHAPTPPTQPTTQQDGGYVNILTPVNNARRREPIPIVRPPPPPQQSRSPPPSEQQINWTNYEALAPYQSSYWIEPNDITRIRSINSNYMKLDVGNCNGHAVIIRTSKNSQDMTARRQIIAETLALTRVSHPNIVKFLGFNITDDIGLQCISEYVDNKTLRDLLNNPRRAAKLTWTTEKINIAIGVASALAYMHSLKPALIHRNIKASKVLLTKGLVPKLSGFEKSRDRTL